MALYISQFRTALETQHRYRPTFQTWPQLRECATNLVREPTKLLFETVKTENQSEDLNVDGRGALKWILVKI